MTHTVVSEKKQVTVATGESFDEYVLRMKQSKPLFGSKQKESSIRYMFTFYYPYTFFEWKVTAPRFVFRDSKALIRIGVNRLSGLAAQTDIWPDEELVEVDSRNLLDIEVSAGVTDDECKRAIENYVYKSLRPLKPPIYELNRKTDIYLPYHVWMETIKGRERVFVFEALTQTVAEAKSMKETKEWIFRRLEEEGHR